MMRIGWRWLKEWFILKPPLAGTLDNMAGVVGHLRDENDSCWCFIIRVPRSNLLESRETITRLGYNYYLRMRTNIGIEGFLLLARKSLRSCDCVIWLNYLLYMRPIQIHLSSIKTWQAPLLEFMCYYLYSQVQCRLHCFALLLILDPTAKTPVQTSSADQWALVKLVSWQRD